MLPFFHEYNALSIPAAQWSSMGEINVATLNTLQHISLATGSITISVYAWTDDIVLSMPTATNPSSILPQSTDEYSVKPVSKTASAVARAAGELKDVPIIGPYARATEIAAGATSRVAEAMGLSRPHDLGEFGNYRPQYVGNLSSYNAPDTSNCLTMDCKQELTIDNRTAGLDGADELSIKSMATKESFVDTFIWQTSTVVGATLFKGYVNPVYFRTYPTATSENEFHFTPSAFVSLPFNNWRGSMKFRFQIVATSFHKGRLKISYEPYPSVGVSPRDNTNYNYLVDIGESRDFTVCVGWGQPQPYCTVFSPTNNASLVYSSTSVPEVFTGPKPWANGQIVVSVDTKLTSTGELSPNVGVNVFVSMCDDFEVQNPRDYLRNLCFVPDPIESRSILPQSIDAGDAPSAPEGTEVEHGVAANKLSPTDMVPYVYFGESIVSMRQFLKRYSLHRVQLTHGGAATKWESQQAAFPFQRGSVMGAVDNAVSLDNSPYNKVNMTILNYVSSAFAGWRGSIRWKYVPETNSNGGSKLLDRRTASSGYLNQQVDVSNIDLIADLHVDSGGLIVYERNNVLEFEVPYLFPRRFTPARRLSWTGSLDDVSGIHVYSYERGVDNYTVEYRLCSVGEDFCLFFFVGVPVLFIPGTVPS
jgi:hypothetical protein